MALLFDQNIDFRQDVRKKYEYSYEYSPSYDYNINVQRDYTINYIINSPYASTRETSTKEFVDYERRYRQEQDFDKEDKKDISFKGQGIENIVLLGLVGLIAYKVVDKML